MTTTQKQRLKRSRWVTCLASLHMLESSRVLLLGLPSGRKRNLEICLLHGQVVTHIDIEENCLLPPQGTHIGFDLSGLLRCHHKTCMQQQ